MRIFIISVLAVMLTGVVDFANNTPVFAGEPPPLSTDMKRLEKYKSRIREHEEMLKDIKIKETSIFMELELIQKIIDGKYSELGEISSSRDEIDRRVTDLEDQVKKLGEMTSIQRLLLHKRAVVLYKLSDTGYLKTLFSSDSYIDILKRYKYLTLILNQDADTIWRYIDNKRELEARTEILKKEKEKLDETVKKVKNKELEILSEKNYKEALLQNVRKEKGYYLKALKEFNNAAEKLENLIIDLEKGGAGKADYIERFENFKGILEPPVNGEIIRYFGRERVSKFNSYLFNSGINISSEVGSEVRCVFGGRIVYANWFRGYGMLMIIAHGNGYHTIYSHLSRFLKESGDVVGRGEVIAKSGDTGSLLGPCLYFEIREKGQAVDPISWLEPMTDGMSNAVIK